MSIKYLVEMAIRTEYPPELALSFLDVISGDLYAIETGRPQTATYWTNWGGTYDNPEFPDIELYFGQFLTKVTTITDLRSTQFSFFTSGNLTIFNLPKKPWQYFATDTELSSVERYSSAARNELLPSDITYTDSVGNRVKVPVRLIIPSVNQRLSDPISGAAIFPTFSFNLINNDGRFDDTEARNQFNTPTRIKRSNITDPTIADFDTIRYGLIESVSTSAQDATVTSSDIARTLTEPVCRKFTTDLFPSLPSSGQDKNIPIGYGSLKNVPLQEVGTNQYIAIDPDYITAVSAVYDRDGVSIAYSFSASTGIITATNGATADVTGNTDNKIGEIIISEITSKSGIAFTEGNWDITEANAYAALSAPINLYINGGDVKSLVETALKNDNAFFITKNDGRLTLRQWGRDYTTHTIPSRLIMEIPRKDNARGREFWFSAVSIKYDKDQSTGVYGLEYFDNSQEPTISERYRKKRTGTFETVLASSTDVEDLATRLYNRFGFISDDIKIKLGYDCSRVNLLDKVEINVIINGRTVSNFANWIVTEVDPAQDVLGIESI